MIGRRATKIDSLDKLLGHVRYTDDINLPRMVFGKIVRSPHAYAKIIYINKQDILKMPGVLDIITGADMPVRYGVIPWTKDEYPLALDKARFVGDGVAAIVATSELIAHEAALKLEITYEILPAVLNLQDAQTTHIKVNEHAKIANITKHVELCFGDIKQEFSLADIIISQDFNFHNTTHASIEPQCAVGDFTPQGRLIIYSATQVPHYVHRSLSEVLKIPAHKIRVVQPPVGGAFGGKSEPFDLEFVVALASMRLKRPVKILYTREEVFFAHRGRHPMNMQLSMGASKEGKILAVENKIHIDGGAYASFGMITAFYAGQLLTGPVGMKSYKFEATRYYTNKPPCGPKRGHGSVQPRFAFEIMCDMMAEKLGLDPIVFRLKNIVPAHSTTINGQKIGSLGVKQVLEEVAQKSSWASSYKKLPFGHGLGIALSMYISGTNYPVYPNNMPQSSVIVRLDRSGLVQISSGASDIGQGSNSVLALIAQEELGVSLSNINILSGDTDLTPVDLGAYSSRLTLMMGSAAQEALRKARHALAQAAAEALSTKINIIKPEDLIFSENKILYNFDKNIYIDFHEAVIISETRFGTQIFSGDYRTVERGGNYKGGSIGASPAYSCTAHVAHVSVDSSSGKLTINKIWVAHDCGKAINPLLVEGQIEGSTYMGAAEVALEHMIIDEDEGARRGLLMNASLLEYRIPTSLDTPDIYASIIEDPDSNGPYGAKEAGEGPLHGAIPAVANAIYDAVGIRLFSLPFSPSKIMASLKQKEEEKVKKEKYEKEKDDAAA
jgi:4-hydroxybenzoyl-CoA reductase alpha subunit